MAFAHHHSRASREVPEGSRDRDYGLCCGSQEAACLQGEKLRGPGFASFGRDERRRTANSKIAEAGAEDVREVPERTHPVGEDGVGASR